MLTESRHVITSDHQLTEMSLLRAMLLLKLAMTFPVIWETGALKATLGKSSHDFPLGLL
jgi:hypothetical protein